MSSRERKIAFIESYGQGHNALARLMTEMLALEGHWFLTDEQIEQITSKLVRDTRRRQHHNMRERARSQARRTMVYVDAGIPVYGANLGDAA